MKSGAQTKAKPKLKKKIWVAAHTHDIKDQGLCVVEPNIPSEFEVQASLWHGLRGMGINARGEVKTSFAGRAFVRFDLAVFESGALTGIIEIKRAPIKHKSAWEETRQGSRYNQFSVPVRIVYGMEQAMSLLEDAKIGKLFAPCRSQDATPLTLSNDLNPLMPNIPSSNGIISLKSAG